MGIELGVMITIISYLVFVTSYVVGLRKDLNSLFRSFNDFTFHLNSLKDLKDDFIRLETKIEFFLNDKKGE
jgi:hypothetical protein